jgi:hypothetical protein
MGQVLRFRHAMAKHLGKAITPEIAAQIELEALYEPDRSVDLAQFYPHEYKGVAFQAESFRAIKDELHVLHVAHWNETERARAGFALEPDYEHMELAELRGELLQFTARKDGVLVGNIRMYLFRDLHTKTKAAREDTLFLLPEVRQGFMASRFIDYAERCLRAIDVCEVWVDTKILFSESGDVVRDVGALMRRRGYTHVANRFHKTLSKE